MRDTISSILSGVSGEYFVAAELSRQGYIASITLRNTKGIDILASNADASKSASIQVKTNRGSRKGWLLNKKAEDYFDDNLFYVFVNLNDGQPPDFHVVPSKVVAATVKKGYARWLATPGRNGRRHKDNPMRNFWDREGDYRNRWDLLGLDEGR
ncbi:MAG: aspartate ammonia-lyase [Chloroflexi bacterium]|nr:aspartate ammonia-lyase [Chloroflexota bacterium]